MPELLEIRSKSYHALFGTRQIQRKQCIQLCVGSNRNKGKELTAYALLSSGASFDTENYSKIAVRCI